MKKKVLKRVLKGIKTDACDVIVTKDKKKELQSENIFDENRTIEEFGGIFTKIYIL